MSLILILRQVLLQNVRFRNMITLVMRMTTGVGKTKHGKK